MQKEMYHLQGNVSIYQWKAGFMAVQGMQGLESLSRALNLASAKNLVHMAVLSGSIGKRVQVSQAPEQTPVLLTISIN